VGFGAIVFAAGVAVLLTVPGDGYSPPNPNWAARAWDASQIGLTQSGEAEGAAGDRGKLVVLDQDLFPTAVSYTGPIDDPSSLAELGEAIRVRGRRAIASLTARSDRLRNMPPTPFRELHLIQTWRALALAQMHEGKFDDAVLWLKRALELSGTPEVPPQARGGLRALLGIVGLRRGEVENCLECTGPSSCIFPIDGAAVHLQQGGSREAVRWFSAYLEEKPGDLRIRWLLNVAYMTLGEYPDKVPKAFLIPLEPFESRLDVGQFENVAPRAGLAMRGPNLGGGSIFDDFNGDGRPDVFSTSLDADRGASMLVNSSDGTFADRSDQPGLRDQVYALNVARADFDNDGDLDVVLLRGGWENPLRLSLLRNRSDATFDDVTIASGLSEPIATESAAWGDYDNDGLVDLFVCGEYHLPSQVLGAAPQGEPDSRNRCRLYHNQGDGTFINVALEAGVANERCAKGSTWGDYDGDGRLDLFVSNLGEPCRLYHNQGDGTFLDMAEDLGVSGAPDAHSFSCWFWDFDNDGRLDLFVNDYDSTMSEILEALLGRTDEYTSHPHLYRNLGPEGFRDVSEDAGLDRPIAAMGANFGDIDNDGYLDAYFGTGCMSFAGLLPNVMLKNVEGRRFEDVTRSTRTGHLQKGHGVSFADWDNDGDLDLFVVLGGGYPSDQGYNALFQNPGQGHHWLKVKLVGTTTNRAALGASIRVDLELAGGGTRSIHRVVGNNGSFGGNTLVETIGLGDTKSVASLTVNWPVSGTRQTFTNLTGDQSIVITEGSETYDVLRLQALEAARSSLVAE
jgi:FG-GAP-like repeat/ASPIC and UnbV